MLDTLSTVAQFMVAIVGGSIAGTVAVSIPLRFSGRLTRSRCPRCAATGSHATPDAGVMGKSTA